MQKSFKKYLVDNLNRIEGIRVSFDKDITPPTKQGVPYDEWVSVNFGETFPSNLTRQRIQLALCTRKDKEADALAQMRDIVVGYLTDAVNGYRRVPLYEVSTWTVIGAMLVIIEDMESGIKEATDGTKFKLINLTLKWGSKV